MKRKIATRKLKRTCICCNKSFIKGDVYYINRRVFSTFDELVAFENLICAKCNYKSRHQNERFLKFIDSGKCQHPILDEVWTTIAGEDYVKEPSHSECCICGKHV